jgi:hypothetical protein
MLEMIIGMALGYIAFTEQGHKIGNFVAQAALTEGKKMIKKQETKPAEKENVENEA